MMSHKIHFITSFKIVGPYILEVHFEDGTTQVVNFEDILAGELYSPLLNPDLFKRVSLDPEVKTLVWPNGADFDPAILHDWPQFQEAWRERMRELRQQECVQTNGGEQAPAPDARQVSRR